MFAVSTCSQLQEPCARPPLAAAGATSAVPPVTGDGGAGAGATHGGDGGAGGAAGAATLLLLLFLLSLVMVVLVVMLVQLLCCFSAPTPALATAFAPASAGCVRRHRCWPVPHQRDDQPV